MTATQKPLNLQDDRYRIFKMAKEWMGIFLRTDDAKGMNQSEVVRRVLDDIVTERITDEQIEKSRKGKVTTEQKSEAKTEEKSKKS